MAAIIAAKEHIPITDFFNTHVCYRKLTWAASQRDSLQGHQGAEKLQRVICAGGQASEGMWRAMRAEPQGRACYSISLGCSGAKKPVTRPKSRRAILN
jgi:hypothetical protein